MLLGGAGGGLLILLASRQHELVNGLGDSAAAAQGDQMLAVSIAVVLAVGVLRLMLDPSIGRIEVPPAVTRAVGVAAVVVVIAGILIAGPSKRWEEFKWVGPVETQSTYVAAHLSSGRGSGRYQFWSAAVDAFKAHPLDGIGAGGYEAYWDQHGSLAVPVRDAHSLFLESMAELGLVGLALILGFLGFAAVSGVRRGPTRSRGGALGAALAILAAGHRLGGDRLDLGAVRRASASSCSRRRSSPGRRRCGKQPALGAVTQAVDGRQRARLENATRSIRARRGDAARGLGRDLGRWNRLPDRGQARGQQVGGERPGLCVRRAGRA